MTATMQPHDFSASFRTSQSQSHPQNDTATFSYADSPLTQLPTIDFQFDDLRRRMSEFTSKFDAYIERGRKQVLAERNDFRARLSELNEEQLSATTQITTLQSHLTSHTSLLARESAELNDLNSQISHLESHASTQRDQRAKLQSAIATIKNQIEQKKAAQDEFARRYQEQASQNGPELQFWETYLGCRIDGAGDDGVVRVVYTFPPAGSATRPGTGTAPEEREATFELSVPDSGAGGFEVTYCKPKLADEKVRKVVDKLNETRDIAVLLKGMRVLFQGELGERMVVR